MIVLEWLFFTVAPVEFYMEPRKLRSQGAATPMMQGIIDLHHDIFYFLILILVFVSWILVCTLWHFHYKKNPIPQRIVHGTTIENKTLFTITICFLFVLVSVHWGLGLGLESLVAACDGGRGSPPSPVQLPEEPITPPLDTPVESSSSSESFSLESFRNRIAANNEIEIYNRITNMENLHYYNIPPQNNPGDYARLVREHFDQAINVNHYRQIYDQESFEVLVLERKGILQDRLHNLMLGEPNLGRILELSPYTDIRKEAYDFLQGKVELAVDLRHAFQRHLLEGNLHFFLNQINQYGRNSEIYQEFYHSFTDHDFRSLHGLPLP